MYDCTSVDGDMIAQQLEHTHHSRMTGTRWMESGTREVASVAVDTDRKRGHTHRLRYTVQRAGRRAWAMSDERLVVGEWCVRL